VDSKVKERIIGAAVLVAFGVWLIPWVLDGSDPSEIAPEPVADANLLPAGTSAPVRTETVELDPVAQPERLEEPVVVPAISALAPEEAQKDPPEVAEASPPEVAEVAAEPTVTPSAPEPAAPEPDGWSVQLGSFTEQANARQLASRVSEYGYQAQVSDYRSDGRTMHRVRVSGFETRDQAEAAASSLSARDFVARVFPPAE